MFKTKPLSPVMPPLAYLPTTANADTENSDSFDYSPPRPPFIKTHSSCPSDVSLGTERKIQRHLEAGNPLYIGFDPEYPPRESVFDRPFPGDTVGQWEVGGRRRKWMSCLACGIPLDVFAKIYLTAGLALAGLALLIGMDSFIQIRKPASNDFSTVLASFNCAWGVFFGTSCIFGMLLMWGKYRHSPIAALLFTICWIFVTLLLLVSSIIWIYFFVTSRNAKIAGCNSKTIKAGGLSWGYDEVPRRGASQAEIDKCMERVKSKGITPLVWGIIYGFMSYSGIIMVMWGQDYRRRLLEKRAWEEFENGGKSIGGKFSEKVGLVMGTAPLVGRMGFGRSDKQTTSSHSHRGSSIPEGKHIRASRPRDTLITSAGTTSVPRYSMSRGNAPERGAISGRSEVRNDMGSSSASKNGLGISMDGRNLGNGYDHQAGGSF